MKTGIVMPRQYLSCRRSAQASHMIFYFLTRNLKVVGAIVVLMICLGFTQTLDAKELEQRQPFVYNDAGKRDPFWPLVSKTGAIITYDETDLSASDMILTGVLTGVGGRSVAVINGKIVKEGDKIGAFMVERVAPTKVILNNGQEKTELHLRKEE